MDGVRSMMERKATSVFPEFVAYLIKYMMERYGCTVVAKGCENDTNITFHGVCCFSVFKYFCQMEY